ncbi:Hypothetical predicted protein, partial [Paramuricea clavata]
MHNKHNSHAFICKTIRRYTSNKPEELIESANPKKITNELNSYFALVGNSTADSVKKLGQEHHIPVIEHQPIKRYPEPEQFSHSQIPREEHVAM